MASLATQEKFRRNVVCVPFPAQRHINPMLKLANILHQKGFHVTFVNTEFNHQRLLKSTGSASLNGLQTFQLQTIPDGVPPSNAAFIKDGPSICDSMKKNCLAPFRDLLSRLKDASSSKVPPVTYIISDGLMSFTLKASQELGIPNVLFWTASACGFMGYLHYRKLVEKTQVLI